MSSKDTFRSCPPAWKSRRHAFQSMYRDGYESCIERVGNAAAGFAESEQCGVSAVCEGARGVYPWRRVRGARCVWRAQ